MKIFSFKKAVSFKDENIVINDLAYNHKYQRENQYLVVEGRDSNYKNSYKAFYDHDGYFWFVRLFKHQHSVVTVSWKEEYDVDTIERIDKWGNRLIVTSTYLSTDSFNHKLVEKSFYSSINNEICRRVFKLNGNKWETEGNFSKIHFRYWLASK
ncbi:MAG: hypothetical protein E7020_05855 [Alphaproteobacteria bacterium]|nr:hypothetical protein [Alphaproteobacteria bacterium]